MALGVLSKSVRFVDPVVVIPDILSKNASVKSKFKSRKNKGKDPNMATESQDKVVKINAWVGQYFYHDQIR